MPDQPTHGGLAGILAQLLAFVSTPWKAVTLGVFLVMGGFGYFVYMHHTELLEAYMTPLDIELNVNEVPSALQQLVDDSGADLVQIWAVDLGANQQSFMGARRKDGERPAVPSPRRLPVIVSTSDVKSLVSVLEGHPACGDADHLESPMMRRLGDRGYRRVCVQPIPPSSEAFVAAIYFAWVTPPGPNTEAIALGAAREVANRLARR